VFSSLTRETGSTSLTTTWPTAGRSPLQEPVREHENWAKDEVPPSEGNEARRNGTTEVRAARTSCEVGEPSPAGPGGAKGRPGQGTGRQKDVRDTELNQHLHKH